MKKMTFIKVFALILISFTLLSGFDIRAIKNEDLPTSFEANKLTGGVVSYPVGSPKTSSIKVGDSISIDAASLDETRFFDPTDNIEYSGILRMRDTPFEVTLFRNTQNLKLREWVNTFYPLNTVDEDGFLRDFTAKQSRELSANTISLLNKYEGTYYISYLKEYERKVLSLTFSIEYYDANDIDEILSMVKVAGKQFDDNIFSGKQEFNRLKDRLIEYNKERNNVNRYEIRNRKLGADTVYYLPWTKDQTYPITQDWGINDNPVDYNLSHSAQPNGYAYDFGLPEGTDVLASSEGTVTYARSGSTSCGGPSYINSANYVVIAHTDGKATNYYHLQSVNVSVGDNVQQGQLIGKSGKTGFTAEFDGGSCAPHLHFQKQIQGASYTDSVPVIFAEYSNQPGDGEIPYPMSVTSQNALTIGSGSNCLVKTDWTTNGPNTISNSNCITVKSESTIRSINGTTRFYIQ